NRVNPQQNGFIERFNGSFRREFLDAYLCQVREMVWFWRQDYNLNRTHESLGHLPPETYRKQLENSNQVCLR
ncbi:TPA: transposase, partial [Yersinia enterocolitica]|nr:transposase [Yersinia enterocolitica]